MSRCLCCVIGLLSVWVVAVSGSEPADDASLPVPIRRYVPNRPSPPQPTPIVAVPAPVAPAERDEHNFDRATLTPVQHLRRAADHLEAAAVGPLAEELCDRAAALRQTADRLEAETTERLTELRKQLAETQKEIAKLEQLCSLSDQILISIRMLEVDTSLVEELGLTLHVASDPGTNLIEQLTTSRNPTQIVPSDSAEALITLLRKNDAARILAEPQIVTTSGRPATIHCGGEFPVPVPQESGTVSMEWREFGVRAEVLPEILGNGRVMLQIAPEVSERDFARSVNLGGHVVPGITTRRVNTQVEMGFGQTLVVGGMTSQSAVANASHQGAVQAIPIPGKERAFRVVSHDEGPSVKKTLLVLVTPRLVPSSERHSIPTD